jgi:hypothetical protein
MKKPPQAVEIYGKSFVPAIGSAIEIDNNGKGSRFSVLLAGDDFADSGYAGSQFRIATDWLAPVIKSLPVDVKITGRTLQLRHGGDCYVRVEINFVGDCEPDTKCGGWLKV